MKQPYNNFQDQFITLAGLEVPGLPETVSLGDDKFVRKPEFHITLLSVNNAIRLINGDDVEALRRQIVEAFYRFVDSHPLTEYKLTGDLRLVEVSPDNKTIVVMAELDGISELFAMLSSKHGVQIPVQPAHITLYTLPTDRFGIPINSYEELDRISKPVRLPEIRKLL